MVSAVEPTIRPKRFLAMTSLGPFHAEQVLRGSVLRGGVPLRALHPEDRRLVRVGRCKGECDRAWAWWPGAARIDEMVCPACGARLGRTSWNVRKTIWLVPEAVVEAIRAEADARAAEARARGVLHGIVLAELISLDRDLTEEETGVVVESMLALDRLDQEVPSWRR